MCACTLLTNKKRLEFHSFYILSASATKIISSLTCSVTIWVDFANTDRLMCGFFFFMCGRWILDKDFIDTLRKTLAWIKLFFLIVCMWGCLYGIWSKCGKFEIYVLIKLAWNNWRMNLNLCLELYNTNRNLFCVKTILWYIFVG